MPEKGSSEAMWLEYIMKLNDRKLNRQKASGFTVWALLTALTILIFTIIENLKLIFSSSDNYFLLWLFISVSINTLSALLIICACSDKSALGRDRRLVTKLSESSIGSTFILFLLILLSALIINVYVGIESSSKNLESSPYYLFGVFFFFLICAACGDWLVKRRARKKGLGLPEAAVHNKVNTIFFVVAFILFSVSIFSITDIEKNIHVLNNIGIIKLTLYIGISVFILLTLIGLAANRIEYDWIENLERKIMIEDLKAEEIRSIFVKEFLGETVMQWLNTIQSEMDTGFNNHIAEIKNAMAELENARKHIEQIRSVYTQNEDEIVEGLKEVSDKIASIENSINASKNSINVISKNIEKIELIRYRGPLTDDEQIILDIIIKESKNKVKENKSEAVKLESELGKFADEQNILHEKIKLDLT
uniref:Uncharacterized protein n=1 Tax=Candidatus Methanogaster sp. ANME-2c ERB4 TaxID=2759911 RepID=A0A7G9YPU9_9EURY|nr:hypothetical protein MMAJBCMK_00016 [Methanosarcinales archaeon ANME-2c ERB4]